MLAGGRSEEVWALVRVVGRWAADEDDVRGVVVVGSWARQAARIDSDVDIVILTDNMQRSDPRPWVGLLGGEVIRFRRWGWVREVRVLRPSGLEVEVSIAPLRWAATEPVDSGTRRVVRDGHRVIYDPDGRLAAVSAACNAQPH